MFKIDIYTLYREIEHHWAISPIMVDVLRSWSTAAGWRVRSKACTVAGVDLETDADVVAFSVYTQTSKLFYELGRALRRKGKIVFMGGPHLRGPTYREAIPYCDVVAHSINADQWFELLREVEKGRMEPHAEHAICIEDKERRFRLPEDLYATYKYHRWPQIPAIFTTLGCPYKCSFCNAFHQGAYSLRNIETIYKEVENASGKVVAFCDATFGIQKEHAMAVFEAVAPLRKQILLETTLQRLCDMSFLNMLEKGGVKAVFVGIENLTRPLHKHGRTTSDVIATTNEVINNLHDRGIQIVGSFIFGMDMDGPDSFETAFRFYRDSELDILFSGVLVPYPNTPLYDNFRSTGRIVDYDWSHYDYRSVVFRPLRMTMDQLADGYTSFYTKITRPGFIFQRNLKILRRHGPTSIAAGMLALHLFNSYDAHRKRRAIHRNAREIPNDIRAQRLCDNQLVETADT
jgi:radical SAM superfamily enzyme YgiQ (UPF0313 family)